MSRWTSLIIFIIVLSVAGGGLFIIQTELNTQDQLTNKTNSTETTTETLKDTDDDGLNDSEEVNKYDTDPTKADTDDDGLNDSEEVNKYDTNPTKADTDDDGLNDSEEVNKYDTNPTKADTDNDKLADGEEVEEYNTDPLNPDTDGDKIPDGTEVYPPIPELAKADPLEKDIFLEIDSEKGASVENESLRKIQEAYAQAPVENPNNQTGINFYYVRDETELHLNTSMNYSEYRNNYYSSEFDYQGYGFYHALIVSDIDINYDGDGHITGFSLYPESGVVVEDFADLAGSILFHEMGHSVGGLHNDAYKGIDSKKISHEEYYSAMNYNTGKMYEYNDGEPFDDWDYFIENWIEPDKSKID